MPLILSGNSGNTTLDSSNGLTFSDNSLQASAASPFGIKNRIINGEFKVSQRGATINSINVDYTYTADRWFITRGGLINYTQGTTNPPTGFQYYGSYINQTAGNAFIAIQQAIESINTYDLLGQTVTLSAWIKAAANTAVSNSIIVTYGYATTADTKAYSTLAGGTSFALSSSAWTKCSITFTVPSNALTLVPVFYKSASFAVGDGYLITGVQLEVGSTATPFERRMYGQELALCQRYYQALPFDGGFVAVGAVINTSSVRGPLFQLNVNMRAAPTITLPTAGSGAGQLHYTTGSGAVPGTIGTNSALGVQVNSFRVEGDTYTSMFTAGQTSLLRLGSGGASITASAEL